MQLKDMTVIVLVGQQSRLMLRDGIRAYRAIDATELERLVARYTSTLILIIEHIKPEDNDLARKVIGSFLTGTGTDEMSRKVIFYSLDNDDNTCGIADEFAADIFLNSEDLMAAIETQYGMDLRTGIVTGKQELDLLAESIVSWDEIYTPAPETVRHADISSRDDSDFIHELHSNVGSQVDKRHVISDLPINEESTPSELQQALAEAKEEIARQNRLIEENIKERDTAREDARVAIEKYQIANEDIQDLESKLRTALTNSAIQLDTDKKKIEALEKKLAAGEVDEEIDRQLDAESQESITELTALLDSYKGTTEDLRKQLAESKEKEAAANELLEKAKDSETLLESARELEDSLKEEQKARKTIETKLSDTESKLAESEAKVERYIKQMKALEEAEEERKKELAERIAEAQKNAEEASNASNQTMEDTISKLYAQLEDLKRLESITRGERDTAQKKSQEAAELLETATKERDDARYNLGKQRTDFETSKFELERKITELARKLETAEQNAGDTNRQFESEIGRLRSEILEQSNTNSELNALVATNKSASSVEIQRLKNEIAAKERAVAEAKTDKELAESKVTELEQLISEETTRLRGEIEVKTKQISDNRNQAIKDISEANKKIEEMQRTNREQGDVLNRVKNQYSRAVESHAEKTDMLTKSLTEANQKLEELGKTRGQYDEKMASSFNELKLSYNNLSHAFMAGYALYEKLVREKAEILGELNSAQAVANNEANSRASTDEKIQHMASKNIELNEKLRDAENRIATARSDIQIELDVALHKIQELEANKISLESTIESERLKYRSLLATSGTDESGLRKIKEDNNAMVDTIAKLTENMEGMRQQLEEAQNTALTVTDKAKEAEERNMVLRSQIQTLARTSGTGGGLPPIEITYNKEAVIVPVFGYSSDGITTMVMSLAELLSKRSQVLVIDLDINTPKVDTWVKIDPRVQGVPKVPNDMDSTALGLFLDKGLDIVQDNFARFIMPVKSTKSGSLSYFSGSYKSRDPNKILAANFAGLFDILGDRFDYIIADLGKIGANPVNDRLIKAVIDASEIGIAFVNNDNYFGLRNIKTKILDAELDLEKIMCCIRCITTKPEMIKQTMKPLRNYTLFIEDKTIQDNTPDDRKQSLLNSGVNKDRLEKLIAKIVKE